MEEQEKTRDYTLLLSIVFTAIVVSGALLYAIYIKAGKSDKKEASVKDVINNIDLSSAQNQVKLPVKWGDLGKKMIEAGVIDQKKFMAMYESRGGVRSNDQALVYGKRDEYIEISETNAGLLLNLFWAFGLSNKNAILEQGPMTGPRYGSRENFASTGGWTLAKGNVMDHYSKHEFVSLSPEQQAVVEKISKNIYRPCCDNSTYFPDCNHGMAMLGLLELLAAQGVSEENVYRIALVANTFWFPNHYNTIARYLKSVGVSPEDINPKILLSAQFSSLSGFQNIAAKTPPAGNRETSGSCGV